MEATKVKKNDIEFEKLVDIQKIDELIAQAIQAENFELAAKLQLMKKNK